MGVPVVDVDSRLNSPAPKQPSKLEPQTVSARNGTGLNYQHSAEKSSRASSDHADARPSITCKWDFGWSAEHRRYYYYNQITEKVQWERPPDCLLKLPSRPPHSIDLDLHGAQFEHCFMLSTLESEQQKLQDLQQKDDAVLEETTAKLHFLEREHRHQKQQAEELTSSRS